MSLKPSTTLLWSLLALPGLAAGTTADCANGEACETQVVNQPPIVIFHRPLDKEVLTVGKNVTLLADAKDSDGYVRQVEFFANGELVGVDYRRPYMARISELPAGISTLEIIATDNLGATSSLIRQIQAPQSGAVSAPAKPYFYSPEPYSSLTLYWQDTNSNETGYLVEQKQDGGSWAPVGEVAADVTSLALTDFDRSSTSLFRVKALKSGVASAPSQTVRVVGTEDTLEVYPEVPGIRNPETLTIDGITFSEMQDQAPADPSQGKATRISTFFTAKVRTVSDSTLLNSPVYETRPQLRNFLPQDDPSHSGGHLPYAYGYYGPNADQPNSSSLHSKHWTNIDASDNIVVRISLLETANLPFQLDMTDLEIHPTPLAIHQVDAQTFDVTLPGASDYARHYRVAVNRNAWTALQETAYRGPITIEAPLFIFVNPMQLAPASAPEDEIVEFDEGQLVVFGAGIHLPNAHYQFLGEGENDVVRELYAPGDAYLHYGFAFQNNNYALKAWGRAIYSDEMFDVYNNGDAGGYVWSDATRTPWAQQDALEGSSWFNGALWEAHTWMRGSYKDEPTIFDGFTNIGARMGVMTMNGYTHLLNHKDVGYGGGIYQHGNAPKAYYRGNLITNDDDITYIHQDYVMEYNTTYIMHNGPSFQFGWQSNFDLHNLTAQIRNHTIWSSDRNKTSFGKNHGVFDSRLRIDAMKNHNGVTFEDFEFYGKETIIWNMRIWDEDFDFTPNTTSILGDKTFKNFNIRQASYNKEELCTEVDVANNKQGYIRFFHFDNLVIEGERIDNIDEGNYFAYNQSCKTQKQVSNGVLLHTVTFFSLPDAVAAPIAGVAPIGETVVVQAANGKFIQADAALPVSLSPAVANDLIATEGFTVVDAGEGYVALRAFNGYFLKADPKRYGYLYSEPDLPRGDENTTEITEDAKFIWVALADGKFALWSKALGLYVRMETNAGPDMPLYAASAEITELESFVVTGTMEPPTSGVQIIKVEAENFASQLGVKTTQGELGPNTALGYIGAGDWASYDVPVENLTGFDAAFRVSGYQASDIYLYADGEFVGSVTFTGSGGWNNWITVEASFELPAGVTEIAQLQLVFTGGLNIDWFELTTHPEPELQLINLNVEAESAIRFEGLKVKTDKIDSIKSGYWAEYDLNLQPKSEITATFRYAAAGVGGAVKVFGDGELLTTLTLPGTGGWSNWQEVSTTLLPASANYETIRLEFETSATWCCNLDSFQLSYNGLAVE